MKTQSTKIGMYRQMLTLATGQIPLDNQNKEFGISLTSLREHTEKDGISTQHLTLPYQT
jgi:hypothetical protein